jgi:hypothetical protein
MKVAIVSPETVRYVLKHWNKKGLIRITLPQKLQLLLQWRNKQTIHYRRPPKPVLFRTVIPHSCKMEAVGAVLPQQETRNPPDH